MEKRAGNMILRVVKEDEVEYLVVKTAVGQFELKLRSDTMMFNIIASLMENNEEGMYSALAHLFFVFCSTAPDEEYLNDIVKAIDACNMRMVAAFKNNEEDEDEKKIIEDMEYAFSLAENIEENSKAE